MLYLKIFNESVIRAYHELTTNKLRSFLSLLGITIGIFCIIAVKSAVDSLEDNIRGSFEKLGNDVIYVSKFSWTEDPNQNWWKYVRRPNITYDDYKSIARRVKNYDVVDYRTYVGSRTLKYRSSSVENAIVIACTYDTETLLNVTLDKGRYYTPLEYERGMNKIVIGNTVAEELFEQEDPIGKTIKLMGKKVEIIGVIEKSGDDLIKVIDFDDAVIVSYPLGKKLANLKNDNPWGGSIGVKAGLNANIDDLKAELEYAIRSGRRMRPIEDNNFSLNELTLLSKLIDGFFGVLNKVGLSIGLFAIFVGIFSVANIMFVSVKERIRIIGIKKALGAKSAIILLEFLIESVILCVIGGLLGLLFVYLTMLAITSAIDFELSLSLSNILQGILIASVVGIISGFLPALQAARMDPVNAIRA